MVLIDFEMLKSQVAAFVDASRVYPINLYPAVHTLSVTGLRVNEVMSLGRWSLSGGENYVVQLEKNSGERAIPRYGLSDEFQYLVDNYPETNFYFRTRQINYFIQKHSFYERYYKGDKEVKSHLFRYFFCRELYNDGWSIEDIKSQIVHSSNSVTESYVHGEIYGITG